MQGLHPSVASTQPSRGGERVARLRVVCGHTVLTNAMIPAVEVARRHRPCAAKAAHPAEVLHGVCPRGVRRAIPQLRPLVALAPVVQLQQVESRKARLVSPLMELLPHLKGCLGLDVEHREHRLPVDTVVVRQPKELE
eukprot:405303-Prymnesium_polylepis.1